MKLIDFLVQELPKRGGWKFGDVAYQDADREVRFMSEEGSSSTSSDFIADILCVPDGNNLRADGNLRRSGPVYRSQYEAALAASNQPAWNGDGIPPQGVFCEVKAGKDLWVHCQIVHSSYAGVAFVYLEEPSKERESKWVGNIDCVQIRAAKDYFRPIRTEEDRKRDGFIDHLMADWLFLGHDREQAGSLYDAIASGKIPGVKIE